MEQTVEDLTPYDRSIIWRLHDAYFAKTGAAAWTGGAIPHYGTSNYPMARQHALLTLALVRELEATGALAPDAEVRLLEVGAGLGTFVARFFTALERGCGDAGRALRRRVRFVVSDYAERTVRESALRPDLAPLVEEGAVLPAIHDVRETGAPVGLDGRPAPGPFAAVFANYVACVSPVKIFRKTSDGWSEKYVRVTADVAPSPEGGADPQASGFRLGYEWGAVDLDESLGDPLHAAAVRDALEGVPVAIMNYPRVFLDFVRGAAAHAVPGGLAVIADFGRCYAREFAGLEERPPKVYGNTLNHDVNFVALEAFCRRAGLAVERTRSPLRLLHTAVVRYAAAMSSPLRAAFRRTQVRSRGAEEVIDLRVAARLHLERGEYASAARLYQRAARLDPWSAETFFRLGEACLNADLPRRALRHLRRGRALDIDRSFDFEVLIGRAYARLDRLPEARRAYERALARDEDPATHANLGLVCERMGDVEGAYRAYRRSLDLEAEGDVARAVRKRLVERFPSGPPASAPGEDVRAR